MPVPTAHGIARIAVWTVTSILSIFGSSAVVWVSSRNWNKVYNRQMSILSLSDMFFTTSVLLQPWLIKQEDSIETSFGTTQTCTAVGFFGIHFSMSVAFANCTLSLYFLFRVAYGWQDQQIVRRLEKPAYLLTLLGPLTIGIPSLLTKSNNLNQIIKICWIDPYPTGCLDKEDVECTRGGWTAAGLSYGVVFIDCVASIIGFYATYKVYKTVRDRIQSSTNRAFQGVSSNAMSNRLQDVSRQSICYSLVYLNTVMWPFLVTLAYLVFIPHQLGQQDPPGIFWLEILTAFFYPLQGFFNFLVFSRPNVQRWRHLHPEWSLFQAFRMNLIADPPPKRKGMRRASSGDWSMSFGSMSGPFLQLMRISSRNLLPSSLVKRKSSNDPLDSDVTPPTREEQPATNRDIHHDDPESVPTIISTQGNSGQQQHISDIDLPDAMSDNEKDDIHVPEHEEYTPTGLEQEGDYKIPLK